MTKKNVSKKHTLTRVSTLSLAITTATFAISGAADFQPGSEFVLEEIIVSAQKREQNLMDVGISVSVLDEQAIRDNRVAKVTDIVLFTANTGVKESFPGLMPVITIRGVGLNDFNATNNPSAGVYVDDVSLSSLALMNTEIIDLASVEVLKGPQGTLYGRNSTAGALNFRTADPDLEGFEAQLIGGIGSYDTTEVEGMINAPVSENLGVRLSVKNVSQAEGFWENRVLDTDVGERDEFTARLQGLWLSPDDVSSVLLKVETQKIRSELGAPEFFGALPTSSLGSCPGSPHCTNFFGYNDTDNDPFKGDWSKDPNYEANKTSATLRFETDLGFADLTSVTGYIDFDRFSSTDVDASPLALTDFYNTDDIRQISQEIRLSESNDFMDWQMGLFYAVDQVESNYYGEIGILNTTSLTRTIQEAVSKAMFANVDWLVTEDVTVITGLRYSRESKDNVGFTQDLVTEAPISYLSFAPVGSGPITVAAVDDEINDSSIAWKLGVNWRSSDSTLLYASATEGHKSGGFYAGVASTSLQLIPYKAETLRAYEVGVKSQLPQFGLSYELSAFYYDYQDVQTYITDNIGALPIQKLSNVNSAEIYGLDAVVRFRPALVEGMMLSAGLGLLQTSFEDSISTISEGNNLPDSPDTTLQLGINYNTQLDDGIEATFALNGHYQGKSFKDATNDPLLEQDAYWLLNGRVSLYFGDDWEAALWGKNLTDKEYISHGFNQLNLGNGYRLYGAPRTYGLSVTKHFN